MGRRALGRRTYVPAQQIAREESAAELVKSHGNDWRRFYVEHPRIRLDGCFISVVTYLRRGEVVSIYAPTHLITFYRYYRFYHHGLVISLLTTDPPNTVVRRLNPSLRTHGLTFGRWRLRGDLVEMSDLEDPSIGPDARKYSFNMTCRLKSSARGRMNKLELLSMSTQRRDTLEVEELPLRPNKPYYFSKVAQYAHESLGKRPPVRLDDDDDNYDDDPEPAETSDARHGATVPTALGGATGDYRDGNEYLPTGFGEIGQYLRNKRRKLQVQNRALLDDGGAAYPQIFAGLSIYINGYTESIGLGELQELLIRHGGVYVPYLDRKDLVTHIVATNLTPTKRAEFRQYKVAVPDWLVESARAHKLLDWRKYSLLAPDGPDPTRRRGVVAAASASAGGFDEERDRRGADTGQQSLFTMLSRAAKPPNSETIESLSQRGARLARAVVLEQQQRHVGTGSIQSFLGPPRPSRPVSRTAPEKVSSDSARESTDSSSSGSANSEHLAAAGTDSAHAPAPPGGPIKHSWLPQKERDSRTTALINDPEWRSKHTSASEDFLQSYFAQSRLHHLSSFKEDLKVLVAARQAGNQGGAMTTTREKKKKKKLSGTAADGRTVFHVDFDCFFVSAGLTTRAELRGKPVAVCHARGLGDSLSSTSEIASCSYEARKFNVKNGMSLGRARELCPEIQTMPFEFERYREFSLKFYDIVLAHADVLQAVSMDEVLFEADVAATVSRDRDPALELAHRIRAEILAATGCPASIGISHNVLLARLATRRAKPASAYHLLPEDVDGFLAPLAVDALPGIGWSLRTKLADELGVSTVGQLREVPAAELKAAIGDGNGKKFHQFTRGIDDSELEVDRARKSVSAEVNYGIRFEVGRTDQVDRFVRELATEVARRLRQEGLCARALALKVMVRHPDAPVDTPKLLGHGWVDTHTRQSTLQDPRGRSGPVDDPELIADVAAKLMHSLDQPPHELRGIGITLHKLERDGHAVEPVRERGQPTLSFAAAVVHPKSPPPPPPSAAPAVTVPAVATAPPPSEREVIVLDSDSDSEPEPVVVSVVADRPRPVEAAAATTTRLLRSRKPPAAPPKPYIPQLFYAAKRGGSDGGGGGGGAGRPASASQVSDAELAHYGIDVEVYRSIGPADQRVALFDARRRKPRFVPPKPKPNKAPSGGGPPHVVLDSSPRDRDQTGTTLDGGGVGGGGRVGEFDELDHVPADVRAVLPALGAATQRELLRRCIAGNLVAAGRGRPTKKPHHHHQGGPVVDVAIRNAPRFAHVADLAAIEDRVERWVVGDSHADASVLHADDVDRFATFLERLVARENGHGLSRACELLRWWRTLLEDEFGPRRGRRCGGRGSNDEEETSTATATAAARGTAWWEGYDRTVQRVEYVVSKETSCRLVL
ncbi:hypothetical protein JCM11491_001576 [Sporobolomyces phaffii]